MLQDQEALSVSSSSYSCFQIRENSFGSIVTQRHKNKNVTKFEKKWSKEEKGASLYKKYKQKKTTNTSCIVAQPKTLLLILSFSPTHFSRLCVAFSSHTISANSRRTHTQICTLGFSLAEETTKVVELEKGTGRQAGREQRHELKRDEILLFSLARLCSFFSWRESTNHGHVYGSVFLLSYPLPSYSTFLYISHPENPQDSLLFPSPPPPPPRQPFPFLPVPLSLFIEYIPCAAHTGSKIRDRETRKHHFIQIKTSRQVFFDFFSTFHIVYYIYIISPYLVLKDSSGLVWLRKDGSYRTI